MQNSQLLQKMEQMHFARLFQNLPKKPYCSFGKGTATLIRSKPYAVDFPLIQVNPPHIVNYLIFDVDLSDAYFAWSDANLPAPTWIAKNKKNGHCHICYELKVGVCKTANARLKPLRYLASIENGLAVKMGADIQYSGLLTKNPLNDDWYVEFLNDRKFELYELADYVDLTAPKTKESESFGLGRNCTMFDTVRIYAYKAIRAHLELGYDNYYADVLERCMSVNSEFLQPLPYSEVKATARSIAKWVWRNHNSAEFQQAFSEKQANRGRKGALVANSKGANSVGGKARSQQYSDMRQQALKLHIVGKSIKEISEYLNVHRNSVSKWLKIHAQVPS